jgi:hypothetical protein
LWAALVALPLAAHAQTAAAPAPSSASASGADAQPVRQQAAIDMLSTMGNYLRSLSQFEVTADTATEAVLDSGQNVTFLHHTVLKLRRPNRFRADVTGAGRDRGIVYDGRHFTIFNLGDGYYSTNPAPPTINGLVQELNTTYNIETPLADLFYWGLGKDDQLALTSAQFIGLERVDSRRCNHYAYRQYGVDWQLWLENGPHPLPCRMQITDTTQTSRPTHEVTYHWDLHVSLPDSTFAFAPSPGSHEITLKPARAPLLGEAQ